MTSIDPSKVYVFLDTNIFLHFRDFENIDWPSALNCSEVCLVVVPINFTELEKFKYDNQNERRRNRARRAVKKINDLLLPVNPGTEAEVEGRPNVHIKSITESPDMSLFPELRQGVNDDHLIASVLKFMMARPADAKDVLLVADDSGVINKARAQGITIKMFDEYRLSDEPTVDQRKILELRRRIGELEDKQPRLILTFSDDQTIVQEMEISVWPLSEEDRQEVERLYREESGRVSWHNMAGKLSHKGALALVRYTASPNDIEIYEREVKMYLDDYHKFLLDKQLWKKARAAEQVVAICVSNDGSMPAHNVIVRLRFPRGLTVYEQFSLDEGYDDELAELQFDMRAPKRPKVPSILSNASWIASIPVRDMGVTRDAVQNPNTYGPNIERQDDGSMIVEQGIEKVPHKRPPVLSRFIVAAAEIQETQNHEVPYEIHADNIEPVSGHLKLHLKTA